jgi:release factor glutamine methyltransferase
MTVREAIAEGSAALRAAGIESPGLDASLLLAEAIGVSRSSLLAAGPEALAETAAGAFRESIRRRLGGECTAYILGRKEFRGMDFAVSPAVLVPRPDTETLVEAALAFAAAGPGISGGGGFAPNGGPFRVLDLCTGSGAVAVSLKREMPALEVWASDISARALEVAQANAARLLPAGSSVRFLRGDLFGALESAVSFSLITANPPYIPGSEIKNLAPEVQKEPLLALDGGDDGLAVIRNIIAGGPDFLCSGGALLLETDPRQTGSAASLLEQTGFMDIKTYRDLSGQERVIAGIWKKR